MALQYSLPSAVAQLATPTPAFIDDTLPAYLHHAMLGVLRAGTRRAVERERRVEDMLVREGLMALRVEEGDTKGKGKEREQGGDEDDVRVVEGTRRRLHAMGLRIGAQIAERLASQRPPLATQLDVVKFVCKDFFLYVYARQIDNLRTNHRGIYVLQSTAFPPLVPLSSHRGAAHDLQAAQIHLVLPAAMIQGALEQLDMPCTVTAETPGLPQCSFQIKTKAKGDGAGPGHPPQSAAQPPPPPPPANRAE